MSGLRANETLFTSQTLKRRAPNKMCLSPEFLKLVQTRCRITRKMEYCVFQMEIMINELTTAQTASQSLYKLFCIYLLSQFVLEHPGTSFGPKCICGSTLKFRNYFLFFKSKSKLTGSMQTRSKTWLQNRDTTRGRLGRRYTGCNKKLTK